MTTNSRPLTAALGRVSEWAGPAMAAARLNAIEDSGLLAVWLRHVDQIPAAEIRGVLVDEPWTPALLDRLLGYAGHAALLGTGSALYPSATQGESALVLIAERLVSLVSRYRKMDVTLPVDRLVDWLMLATAARTYTAWARVDVMLLGCSSGEDGQGDEEYLDWMAAPVMLAPLLWAAGYSASEAAQAAPGLDPERLAVLAALNGWHLPTLVALP